jgi:hypothetical protein
MNVKTWILAGVSAIALFSAANPASAQSIKPTIGGRYYSRDPMLDRVVKYAAGNRGRTVGGGQCTDLVNAALNYAEAKQLEIRKATPGEIALGYNVNLPGHEDEFYVWGRAVKSLRRRGGPEPVIRPEPGSILQFERCAFANGYNAPHHTAIVVSRDGTKVVLLHQNDGVFVGGKTVVSVREVDLSTKVSGTIRMYLPQARPQ